MRTTGPLREGNARLNAELVEARRRLDEQADRVAALSEAVARLEDGLHEARRLNLRVAEVTDVVTELVLPLHDRELDPAVLQRLRADTL